MQMLHQTERLFLKISYGSDSKHVLEFYERNKVFLEPFEPERVSLFYTESFHKANLNYEYNEIVNRHMIRFWLYEKHHPDKVIGSVCLQNIVRGVFLNGAVGYKMDKDFLRRGYAFEALNYLIHLAFYDYTLHRLEAFVVQDNYASINLLKKLGFFQEGTACSSVYLNGEWQDQLRYAFINPGC